MGLQELFYNCFQVGIETYTGYNACNTTAYALGFILLVYGIWKAFQWLKLRVDYGLFTALVPYVMLISSLRVIEDFRLVPRSSNPLELGFYTITPGIYAVGTIVIVGGMLLAWRLGGKNWKAVYGKAGWMLLLPFMAFYLYNQSTLFTPPYGPIQVVLLTLALSLAFKWALPRLKVYVLEKRENLIVTMAGALDAAATTTALQFYGFQELHVVPNYFIALAGTPYIFLFKVPIVIGALWLLDEHFEKDDKEMNLFTKMALLVLPLGPGFRDFLLLLTKGA